jgi:hypothetical protein
MEAKGEALLTWLRDRGAKVADGVQLVSVPGKGLGAVATKDIPPGSLVMRVALEARERGVWTPVAITTEAVRSQTGILGAIGRALALSGKPTKHSLHFNRNTPNLYRCPSDNTERIKIIITIIRNFTPRVLSLMSV